MVLFLWIHGNPTGFLPAVLYLRCKTRRFPCGEHKGTRDNETGRNNVKQRGTGDDGNVGHWKITDQKILGYGVVLLASLMVEGLLFMGVEGCSSFGIFQRFIYGDHGRVAFI